MRKRFAIFAVVTLGCLLFAAADYEPEPLPEAISNNAVAIAKVKGEMELFSFMGIGAKKTWDAVTSEAYTIDVSTGKA